ncbi:hypothetical protein SAMN04490248_11149 [Salinihabitans flavidus]|uniref:Uncharacterized protein n=1 Tax=Salinihabitans flavidus TaxID=569882 RepID=A0A1H8S909_9RHOB|nr:hypothetical protein [Salinihabitans flavidus]SEO75037.1 hypothetical protein SAMN04490248_11149 [Salinihabitans flavidus]
MSFLRPEARATILRWREVLIGLGVLALGLWWASGGGILRWVGIAVAIGGALLIHTGVQRARFRRGQDGPGLVRVVEGQVSYFGPISGGIVSVEGIERLVLDPSGKPAHWVLERRDEPPIHIPVTADGAEALFDVFSTLPGLRTGQMVDALDTRGSIPVVVWERKPSRPPNLRLQ